MPKRMRDALRSFKSNHPKRNLIPTHLSENSKMSQLLKLSVCGLLVAAMVVPAVAQEKKKKKKGARQPQQIAQLMKRVEAADLSDEETAKVKEIAKQFAGKLAEVAAKRREAVGPDAMKAMNEARKAAADAGKKGAELRKAAMAALTDEQKAALAETQKAQTAVMKEMQSKIVAAVGEEKAKKLIGRAGGKQKAKGKKKKAA